MRHVLSHPGHAVIAVRFKVLRRLRILEHTVIDFNQVNPRIPDRRATRIADVHHRQHRIHGPLRIFRTMNPKPLHQLPDLIDVLFAKLALDLHNVGRTGAVAADAPGIHLHIQPIVGISDKKRPLKVGIKALVQHSFDGWHRYRFGIVAELVLLSIPVQGCRRFFLDSQLAAGSNSIRIVAACPSDQNEQTSSSVS